MEVQVEDFTPFGTSRTNTATNAAEQSDSARIPPVVRFLAP
jgi:hypothetical protein